MKLTRRQVLYAGLLAASSSATSQAAWPTGRPIRMIVPFGVGGATDIAARVLAQALTESLKTSVVVENKGGAHGVVGITDAMRAPADGYTLLMGSIGTMGINPRLHEKLPYDANKDFAAVSLVTMTFSPNIFAIPNSAL